MQDRLLEQTARLGQALRRLAEQAEKANACAMSGEDARQFADLMFQKAGLKLADLLPEFDQNYRLLARACGKALGISRVQMPVIEPTDMDRFNQDLKTGNVDIFSPYTKGKLHMPPEMEPHEGEEWVTLGAKDGDPADDVVKAKLGRIEAGRLLPTQNEIWLDKVLANLIKFGIPKAGSPILDTTVIVSKEGYILDGHHRWAQAVLADPKLGIRSLLVPFDIQFLLQLGRSYGAAIGNKPKP